MSRIENQRRAVLQMLIDREKGTNVTAFHRCRTTRLGGVIHALKQKGYNIITKTVYDPADRSHHWAEYYLEVK